MGVATPARRPEGFEEVALAQRDSIWQIVPPERGGALGVFWYRPEGPSFDWILRVEGLTPNRVYRLQLNVDGKFYSISSLLADWRGLLRGYGSLNEFRELLCGSSEHLDAPIPLAGEHEFGVWILDDGTNVSSPSGTRGDPLRPVGRKKLPCAGNGDASYELRLTEVALAQFEGR